MPGREEKLSKLYCCQKSHSLGYWAQQAAACVCASTTACPVASAQQEASSTVRCAQALAGIVVRQYPEQLPSFPKQSLLTGSSCCFCWCSTAWCCLVEEGSASLTHLKLENWSTASSTWIWGETLLWEQPHTETGCPEMMWGLLLERFKNPLHKILSCALGLLLSREVGPSSLSHAVKRSTGALLLVLRCSWVWDGFVCIWYLETGRNTHSIRIIKKVEVKRCCLLRSCLSAQLRFNLASSQGFMGACWIDRLSLELEMMLFPAVMGNQSRVLNVSTVICSIAG